MNIIFTILVTFILCSGFCSSFNETKNEINKLPCLNQSVIANDIEKYCMQPFAMHEAVPDAHLPGLTFDEFHKTQIEFFKVMQKQLNNSQRWLNANVLIDTPIPTLPPVNAAPHAPSDSYFDANVDTLRQHYVQKLEVPVGAKVLLHGDLHGDIHSIIASLTPYMKGDTGFKLQDDLYLMFLGDYTDKGLYGLECLYLLMRLKIDNPERVYLVRGNHEDYDITARYGFQAELSNKGFSDEQARILHRLYDILPVALYMGCSHNWVQLCHGGLELGYLPTKLLNHETAQYEWLVELNRREVFLNMSQATHRELGPLFMFYPYACHDHMIPIAHSTMDSWAGTKKLENTQLGFMWTDFQVEEDLPCFYRGRGFIFNKRATNEHMALTNTGNNRLCTILRAHQHNNDAADSLMRLLLNLDNTNEENKGIAKLWANDQAGHSLYHNGVVTFNLSPNTLMGPPQESWPGFDFDTMGLLQTAADFSDWTLEVKRTTVQP
ncbi:MAG: metallophosphoesterase [Chlamydiales bacterium]|nr:metallophosphoesterase [Chlamydiales bacterium]